MYYIKKFIKKIISDNQAVLFIKGTAKFPLCIFSGNIIKILKRSGIKRIVTVNVSKNLKIRQGIKYYSDWPMIPQLYIMKEFIGGFDIIKEINKDGKLKKIINNL